MDQSELAVDVRDLCRNYVSAKRQPGIGGAIRTLFSGEKTTVHAVKNVSLQLAHGEVVGFLGPNGAGKTTTIKMLAGIMEPTSGSVEVLGYRPASRNPELLRQISLVMGNKNQLWWDLPAIESFRVMSAIYGVSDADFRSRVDFLASELQITDHLDTQVRKMSLGERMKCELIAALIHRPRILFLDEPTIGLDVVSQKRIRDFLKRLNQVDKCTILLTSHYMQDVEELCERVVMINHGEKVYDGPIGSLLSEHSQKKRLALTLSRPLVGDEAASFGEYSTDEEGAMIIEVDSQEVAAFIARAVQVLPVVDVAIQGVSLEDIMREKFSQPVA
ncbi:MAG: ATP-binding cassette domain-containing protein [Chthonomonas sp.]|nr:ATP-binding cassette domain-containing protein [Chthonomonas sp.]